MGHLQKNRISYTRPETVRAGILCVLAGILLSGCAAFAPRPFTDEPFRARAAAQAEKDVRVSVAVLDAEETEAVFGLPLYRKGIQPIWLEIENNTEHRMWFAPVSVDRDYFSPLEVALSVQACGQAPAIFWI